MKVQNTYLITLSHFVMVTQTLSILLLIKLFVLLPIFYDFKIIESKVFDLITMYDWEGMTIDIP